MRPTDALRVALRAIVANRLRSSLTTLGMIIGVSSVIVLISVGQGAQEGVASEIRGLGSDLLFVQPGTQEGAQGGGAAGQAATLTLSDAQAVGDSGNPEILGVAPQLSLTAQAIGPAANQVVTVIGTTSEYPFVRDAQVAAGSFVTVNDVDDGSLHIVLGSAVAQSLFPDQDPVGESLRISLAGGRITFDFDIVGVMDERGGAGDEDNFVFIPVTTLQSRLQFLRNATGDANINQINIKVDSGADKDDVGNAVSNLLLFRHGEEDFTVSTQNDLLSAATNVSTTLSILLGSVAGISLLVGAIGVMNIMLVSVAERTREIGIRRAVGARGRDIVMQFVTEALTLTIGGGALGIAVGVGISLGIDNRSIAGQDITTLIQPWSIIVAFAVAVTIGLISGSYPAYRATAVDPIAALRIE